MSKEKIFSGILCVLLIAMSSFKVAATQQETPYFEPAAKLAAAMKQHKFETIVVSDFSSLGGEVNDLGRLIAEDLSAQLVLHPGLRVIDRSVISNILRKSNLPLSELDSPEVLKRIGKEVGAQAIVKGTMHSTESKVRLNIKLVDISSGQLCASMPVELPRTESVEKLEADSTKVPVKHESPINSSSHEVKKIANLKTVDKKYNAEPIKFGRAERFLATFADIQRNNGQVIVKINITNINGRTQDPRICAAVLKDTFTISEEGTEFQVVDVLNMPMMVTAPDRGQITRAMAKATKCIAGNVMAQAKLIFPDSVPLVGPLTVSANIVSGWEGQEHGYETNSLVLKLLPVE